MFIGQQPARSLLRRCRIIPQVEGVDPVPGAERLLKTRLLSETGFLEEPRELLQRNVASVSSWAFPHPNPLPKGEGILTLFRRERDSPFPFRRRGTGRGGLKPPSTVPATRVAGRMRVKWQNNKPITPTLYCNISGHPTARLSQKWSDNASTFNHSCKPLGASEA